MNFIGNRDRINFERNEKMLAFPAREIESPSLLFGKQVTLEISNKL